MTTLSSLARHLLRSTLFKRSPHLKRLGALEAVRRHMATSMQEKGEKYLSSRGRSLLNHDNFLSVYLSAYIDNPYSEKNPDGIICLGTADNMLCDDLLVDKLNEIDRNKYEPWMLHYYRYEGVPKLTTSATAFINRYFNPHQPVKEEHVLALLGTCSVFDIMAFAVAEPGDVFLCPTPVYTRIQNDLHERALVDIQPIELTSQLEDGDTRSFQLTLAKVVRSYEQALREGKNVKGMVILNPHNPLTEILSMDKIMPILHFCKEKELLVLIDEIYALTVHAEPSPFQSILSVPVPDPQRTVWMWGLSKDLCLPGLRATLMVTENPVLLDIAAKLIVYQCIPAPLHHTIAKLLEDYDWLDTFLAESRRRLKENLDATMALLNKHSIPVVNPQSGLFVFADFRKLLSTPDAAGELALFHRLFKEERVYAIPGTELFCKEPGWFRLTFSIPRPYLDEGKGD